MWNYDFLAAVVRDGSYATGMSWWIFLTVASVMVLIALIILFIRTVVQADEDPGLPAITDE